MRLQEAVLEDESAPMRVLELASVVDGHLATIVCGSDSGADTSKGLQFVLLSLSGKRDSRCAQCLAPLCILRSLARSRVALLLPSAKIANCYILKYIEYVTMIL